MGFEVPILFLVFNRPDTTARVFERIREIKPEKLFIAADGPRPEKEGEREKCDEVRDIIMNGVDWPCEVKTLFRDSNLGCGLAVSGAITWFFGHVDEGIILEDDILASHSFFYFAKELLRIYRDDESVWHIGGNSYNSDKPGSPYYFSAYPHIWGWATWRRAWNNYQYRLNDIDHNRFFKNIRDLFLTQSEKKFWIDFYKEYFKVENTPTWDYQWTCRMWYNKGLALLPRENLITNIGFTETATHTSDANSWLGNLVANEIEIPKDKLPVKQDKEADLAASRKVFYIRSKSKKILSSIKRAVTSSLKEKNN